MSILPGLSDLSLSLITNQLLGFFFAFSVGLAGFFAFKLLRLPTPALLGPMVSTGILSVMGHYPDFATQPVSFAGNVLIGIMLGMQVDRTVLGRLRSLGRHVSLVAAGMIALSLVCGYAIYYLTDIPLVTSLISGAAGGIAEMSVFGISVNADVPVIAFVQFIRIVVFLALIPYLATAARRLEERSGHPRPIWRPRDQGDPLPTFAVRDYFKLAIVSILAGWLGLVSRIPTGAMLGAMIAGGTLAFVLRKRYLYPASLGYFSQILLGTVMGQRIDAGIVDRLGSLVLPVAAVTALMLAGSLLLAVLLYWSSGWDFTTCLVCASPAGLSQVAMLASEIGVDLFTITIFHSVRIIGIVSIYPWIIMALTGGHG